MPQKPFPLTNIGINYVLNATSMHFTENTVFWRASCISALGLPFFRGGGGAGNRGCLLGSQKEPLKVGLVKSWGCKGTPLAPRLVRRVQVSHQKCGINKHHLQRSSFRLRGMIYVFHSGEAMAFPSRRVAHPERPNEEENEKNLSKNKRNWLKVDEKKKRKCNTCPPGTVRLATAMVFQILPSFQNVDQAKPLSLSFDEHHSLNLPSVSPSTWGLPTFWSSHHPGLGLQDQQKRTSVLFHLLILRPKVLALSLWTFTYSWPLLSKLSSRAMPSAKTLIMQAGCLWGFPCVNDKSIAYGVLHDEINNNNDQERSEHISL